MRCKAFLKEKQGDVTATRMVAQDFGDITENMFLDYDMLSQVVRLNLSHWSRVNPSHLRIICEQALCPFRVKMKFNKKVQME